MNALAQAAGDYRTAVLLLAPCGLRWGELAGRKVGRVDLMRRRVSVVEAVSEARNAHLAHTEVASGQVGADPPVPP